MSSIPAYIRNSVEPYAELPALRYAEGGERRAVTYRDLFDQVARFARGLLESGVEPGDRVLHLADNSERWIVADLGILRAGAVSVPRGADSTKQEIAYILSHSKATAVVAESPKLLEHLPDGGAGLRARILVTGGAEGAIGWDEILSPKGYDPLPEPEGSDLATIVYTSGTTGTPKGVMLTHANILHNVRVLPPLIGVVPEDRFLSVLPSWHMFERTVEYVVLASGATLSYSSLRTLKDDLRTESPTFMAAVPRLWEGLYAGIMGQIEKKSPVARAIAVFFLARAVSFAGHRAVLHRRLEDPRGKVGGGSRIAAAIGAVVTAPLGVLGRRIVGKPVRAALGGRLRGAVSGGGMLPLYLDRFLDALGVPILVGYGLTETSPVVTVRRFADNVLGTIGRALPETEVRVVDATGEQVPPGTPGEVEVKGPQVMLAYYANDAATRSVLRGGGWFRTGDICSMTGKGDLIFTGRLKETIVLAGGENIEPDPIESKILESPFVRQVMVVGQDRKTLAALIVPDPDRARAEALARRLEVEEFLRREIRRLLSPEAGFKARERISRIAVLGAEFNVDDGTMTRTLKLRRQVILEKYAEQIDALYG